MEAQENRVQHMDYQAEEVDRLSDLSGDLDQAVSALATPSDAILRYQPTVLVQVAAAYRAS